MLDLLQGIRIISFNHFLLGPMGIQALADVGADVIAVETPEGAWQRHWSSGDIWRDGQGMRAYVHEPQQAQRRARLEVIQGQRDRAQAHRRRRCGRREFPPGRHGQARLRLRRLASAQACFGLCVGIRLWPRRSICAAARSGSAGAGPIRDHGDHRRSADRASPGRRVRGRPPWGGAVRDGHPCRAAAPASAPARAAVSTRASCRRRSTCRRNCCRLAQCRAKRPATFTRASISPAGIIRLPTASMPRATVISPCRFARCRARRSHRRAAAGFVLRQDTWSWQDEIGELIAREAEDEIATEDWSPRIEQAQIWHAPRAGLCRPRGGSAGQAHAGAGDRSRRRRNRRAGHPGESSGALRRRGGRQFACRHNRSAHRPRKSSPSLVSARPRLRRSLGTAWLRLDET